MALQSNTSKPKGYYWGIIGKVLTGLSAVAAIVAVILTICDENIPKIQKFLDKQSKDMSFLTRVTTTDSLVINNPEFKLYNSIQDKIELYFRECQLLKFEEVPSSYKSEYDSEVCKSSLQLLMSINTVFGECRKSIQELTTKYPNKTMYFDFIKALKVLEKGEVVTNRINNLANLNANDKQQYLSQIREFLNSHDLYDSLEVRMNFLLSAYETMNVFKLQLMTAN